MKYLFAAALMLFSFLGVGQDLIVLKNGGDIEAKVLEILDTKVKYKKQSNLNGPSYSIAKSEIFMIKYASGDKDVFSNYQEASPSKTSNQGFVYDPRMGSIGCQSNKRYGVKVFGTGANQIFFRGDVVFYGYDFTYLKLTNPKKTNDGINYVNEYVYQWNDLMMKKFIPLEKMKKWLGKPNLRWGTGVFGNYRYNEPGNFVVPVNYCVSFNEIQEIVASYELNDYNGIGMVVNVINFNKIDETVTVYITFFDIESRSIMFATQAVGKASGSGMDGHWAEGINSAVRDLFIDEVYKPRRVNNGMIPPKLLLY